MKGYFIGVKITLLVFKLRCEVIYAFTSEEKMVTFY